MTGRVCHVARPGRHRAVPVYGPWRTFLRCTAAVALNSGGVLALVLAVVVEGYATGVALKLTALGVVLVAAGTWLALPPGEAWQRLTGWRWTT